MHVPNWDQWPEIWAVQLEDVTTPGPKYPFPWLTDYRSWVPEVMDTGFIWTTQGNIIDEDILMMIQKLTDSSTESDLWNPAPNGDDTTWQDVIYPK
jgi:hypothetical protein|tara:strand:+ start:1186 stop:1473 length:288 start_codon:yes stop_codon:yes gene_type:complete